MTGTQIQQTFSLPLLDWFDQYGRHDLPWQLPRDPYRIWVSEIMLQQTQVKTVIPYFNRFLSRFPDIQSLAISPEDDVLAYWSGLGYYSRARNLHKTAGIIVSHYQGNFPSDVETLVTLPGIGASTAAAIASLAFDKSTAILDGNVKRVLCRYFLITGLVQQRSVHQTLWQLAQDCMPNQRCADYTQAIMDLGATCCTAKNPTCNKCPLQNTCLAKTTAAVDHYPNKKPKKVIPTKHQQFLLIHHDYHYIYLEKRPPTGIWGGLWCLPAIDIGECPKTYVTNTYALETVQICELMSLKHSFSHFHLHIKAISIAANPKKNKSGAFQGRWFTFKEMPTLGLAKPVRDIIQYFRCKSDVGIMAPSEIST